MLTRGKKVSGKKCNKKKKLMSLRDLVTFGDKNDSSRFQLPQTNQLHAVALH